MRRDWILQVRGPPCSASTPFRHANCNASRLAMPMGILAACITSHMQVCTASAPILMERSAADVHVLLGDIGLEEERFDSSAIDYESALKLLMQKLEVGSITESQHASVLHYDLLSQCFTMSSLP